MRDKRAWKTMNWIRIGAEVFMVQQEWQLYREKEKKSLKRKSYASISQQPFPTDNWRVVNLKDVVGDNDLMELMEAKHSTLEGVDSDSK